MDILSVLIWVQTVCIGYQQMTKVAASNEKNILINYNKCFHMQIWHYKAKLIIQGYTLIFLIYFNFIFFAKK